MLVSIRSYAGVRSMGASLTARPRQPGSGALLPREVEVRVTRDTLADVELQHRARRRRALRRLPAEPVEAVAEVLQGRDTADGRARAGRGLAVDERARGERRCREIRVRSPVGLQDPPLELHG